MTPRAIEAALLSWKKVTAVWDISYMTRSEWLRECPEDVRPEGAICPHRMAVLDALRLGHYVPRRVRADYPDLEQKYPELFVKYRREKKGPIAPLRVERPAPAPSPDTERPVAA